MLATEIDVPDPRAFDLSFSTEPVTGRSGRPLQIALGEPVSGPFVGIFYDRPSTIEELGGPPDLAPPHGHSADSFRICLKGELIVGQERYHHGEFRFQEAGRPYGRDGDAPHVEGNWRIIMFADKRGFRTRPVDRALWPEVEAKAAPSLERFGPMLPELREVEWLGVRGLSTMLGTPSRIGHLDGSFADRAQWRSLGDGTVAAAGVLGDPISGPVVLLTHSEPGAVAMPGVTFGTESFRLVVAGSCQLDGRSHVMGDMRAQAADVPWDAVVAGPDGLDQVLILGDRRGVDPDLPTGSGGWADLGQLTKELAGQLT